MLIDPAAAAKLLADAGGWAVVVAILIAVGAGAVRGWWVPGFVYRREVARADAMTAQAGLNTTALADLTNVVADALEPTDPRRRRRARASLTG